MKPRIVVLCTHNAVRSQMAEAYLRKFLGDYAEVFSAGLIADRVNPLTVAVLQEDGLDISNQTSKVIEDLPVKDFQYVLTVCDHAREHCPVLATDAVRIHQAFTDPAAEDLDGNRQMEAFRNVRDQIKTYCKLLALRVLKGKVA